MTRVKICGITSLEDAKKAVELGTDALGFVFAKSPRRINQTIASKIIKELPPFVSCVGVFVNEKENIVKEIAKDCRLDMLQFHGNETSEYCQRFKKDYKVIKAIRIKNEESVKDVSNFLSLDAILLDTYSESLPGGTGKQFNWELGIKAKTYNIPIILSGGLNPDNVLDAIEKVEPYMVDVSSGIETAPGKKDYKLMKEFIEKVKSRENSSKLEAPR